MKISDLIRIMEREKCNELEFTGNCCDCHKSITVLVIERAEDIVVSGGAIYDLKRHLNPDTFTGKCNKCWAINPEVGEDTEVWSRIVGYLRPRKDYNKGKQAEVRIRKNFNINKAIEEGK